MLNPFCPEELELDGFAKFSSYDYVGVRQISFIVHPL
jgi:hypothetical protein